HCRRDRRRRDHGATPDCGRRQRPQSFARRGGLVKRAISMVVVALLLAAAPARIPTAQAERELTLDEALALGKKRNKSMAAERARLEQAQTALSSAWALLLPTITDE